MSLSKLVTTSSSSQFMPTSGLLSSSLRFVGLDRDQFRSYTTWGTSSMRINDKDSVSNHSILTSIGRRRAFHQAMPAFDPDLTTIVQEFPALASEVDVVRTIAESKKGDQAWSASFGNCDLSGLVYRLAAAVSTYAACGQLTPEKLMGGDGPCRVIPRGQASTHVSVGRSHVFLPKYAGGNDHDHVMAAMFFAVHGAGSTTLSDSFAVDGNNVVLFPAPTHGELALACVRALMLLGNFYAKSEASALFMTAFVVGMHSELSVVGHTDEGAFNRTVLRRNQFQPPSGFFLSNGEPWSGCWHPNGTSLNEIGLWADTMVLYTAACYGVCDPMMAVSGRTFPTVVAVDGHDLDDRSHNGTDADAMQLAGKIGALSGVFCKNLITAWCAMFKMDNDACDLASTFLVANYGSMVRVADRHLRQKVAAPWFWIEGTGILGEEVANYPLVKAGYGPYAYREKGIVTPCTETVRLVTVETSAGFGMAIDFTAARKNKLLQHLMNNDNDGLGTLILRQVATDYIALSGNAVSCATDVNLSAGMQAHLWTRGHSSYIAPAEFLNMGGALGIYVVRTRIGRVNEEMPWLQGAEINPHAVTFPDLQLAIKWSTTRPVLSASNAALQAPNRGVNRNRCAAIKALRHTLDTRDVRNLPCNMPISTSGGVGNAILEDRDPHEMRRVIGGIPNVVTAHADPVMAKQYPGLISRAMHARVSKQAFVSVGPPKAKGAGGNAKKAKQVPVASDALQNSAKSEYVPIINDESGLLEGVEERPVATARLKANVGRAKNSGQGRFVTSKGRHWTDDPLPDRSGVIKSNKEMYADSQARDDRVAEFLDKLDEIVMEREPAEGAVGDRMLHIAGSLIAERHMGMQEGSITYDNDIDRFTIVKGVIDAYARVHNLSETGDSRMARANSMYKTLTESGGYDLATNRVVDEALMKEIMTQDGTEFDVEEGVNKEEWFHHDSGETDSKANNQSSESVEDDEEEEDF